MEILFTLNEHENRVTPLKVADALIENTLFSRNDLREISRYLNVYVSSHRDVDGVMFEEADI